MIRLGGIFDRTTAELVEMLYQYEFEYVFELSQVRDRLFFQTHHVRRRYPRDRRRSTGRRLCPHAGTPDLIRFRETFP